MSWYPLPITATGHVEPVARRVRATLGGRTVFDTTRALYLWEWPYYPQFQVPAADIDSSVAVDEARLRRNDGSRDPRLADTVCFEWDALDHWFEEDEEVFVHPRNPYVRVDALRSTRHVRVELEGELLAESSAPVLVFETGLPTRHYFDPSAVDMHKLERSETVTQCPYKGRTSSTWTVLVGGERHADLAWSYAFPTRQLLPIAGLIAFYDEKVDTIVDGLRQPRPQTHFG